MPYTETDPPLGYKGRHETGQLAASTAASSAELVREAIMDHLGQVGRPMSADELAEDLGRDILSIRPRCSDLSKMGVIRDSGQRGKTRSGRPAVRWEVNAERAS